MLLDIRWKLQLTTELSLHLLSDSSILVIHFYISISGHSQLSY